MLAPKISNAQTKASDHGGRTLVPQRPTLARQRFGRDPVELALLLQRTIGNQATLRLLAREASGPAEGASQSRVSLARPAILQRKLVVGQENDPLEREAERAVDQVMRMPEPEFSVAPGGTQLSRKHAAYQTQPIRPAKLAEPAANEAPPIVHQVLSSQGQPLNPATREFMEPRFGHDFSGVRVHEDSLAADSARAIRAQAYTVGSNIVFAAGAYAPSSAEGQQLLAHELGHVVQQASTTAMQGPTVAVQRAPAKGSGAGKDLDKKYPAYESADSIMEISRDNDTWSLTVNGFTSAASLVRLLWPRLVPPSVQVTLRVAITEPIDRGWFTLTGITYDTVNKLPAPFAMEPSIAKLFAAHGLEDEVTESAEVINARKAFREQHQGHGEWVLDAIDVALRRIAKRNPELLISYYRYYETHDLKDETHLYTLDGMNFDGSKQAGTTARGNSLINPSLLKLEPPSNFPTDDPISLLAGTLVHEYTHTHQPSTSDPVTTAQFEAKAYGVEIFFSGRMGDKKRADFITTRSSNDKIDQIARGDKILQATQEVMAALYQLIDNGGPAAQEAKHMSVEFISKNAGDFGPKLKALIATIRDGELIP